MKYKIFTGTRQGGRWFAYKLSKEIESMSLKQVKGLEIAKKPTTMSWVYRRGPLQVNSSHWGILHIKSNLWVVNGLSTQKRAIKILALLANTGINWDVPKEALWNNPKAKQVLNKIRWNGKL